MGKFYLRFFGIFQNEYSSPKLANVGSNLVNVSYILKPIQIKFFKQKIKHQVSKIKNQKKDQIPNHNLSP